MQHSDAVQRLAEGLFAGFMPEQLATGIGARGSADQRQHQQRRFRDPLASGLRLHFVDTERGEGGEVDTYKGGRDVGGGSDFGEGHLLHNRPDYAKGNPLWSGIALP